MELLRPGATVAEHFHVIRLLGRGSFGEVVEARDLRTGAFVAIKVEPRDARDPQLLYEYRIMTAMAGEEGFPRALWFGFDSSQNMLVMQRLNQSLDALRQRRSGATMPLEYLAGVAVHGLQRLRAFHGRGFVHRDLKPDNFMVSHGLLYLIDFGLSKRVLDPDTGVHIPFRSGKALTGTPRFASTHAQAGDEQSRRDDLEAFAYTLVYLAKGRLAWQGLPAEEAARVKRDARPEGVASGLPAGYAGLLRHARGLGFGEVPNYVQCSSGTWV